jgi:hypothetical protein
MRRIDRLEEPIGCKLFLRDQSGLTELRGRVTIGDVMRWSVTPSIFSGAAQTDDTAGTVRFSPSPRAPAISDPRG